MTVRQCIYVCIAILVIALITLFTMPWSYRLGDCVCGPSMTVRLIGLMRYPEWSLAHMYMRRSLSYTANLDVLDHVVPQIATDEVIVHLRVGDVIDNHQRDVATFWSGQYKKSGFRGSVTGAGSEGYIRDRAFFQFIVSELQKLDVHAVTIVAGTHHAQMGPKSQAYIDLVCECFGSNGIVITRQITTKPDIRQADADFARMCNARIFVASGGGFSRMAADVATRRGATVLGQA